MLPMALADVFKGLTQAATPFQVVSPHAPVQNSEQAAVQPHPEPEQRATNQALELLEKKVKHHRLSWIMAGEALAEIRDSRLYRCRAIDTFEEYCLRRWELSRRHAYDLIAGFQVAGNCRGVTHLLSLRAAVELARLPADEQAKCLSECIAGSHSRSPPADYIRAAVAARRGLPKRKTRKAHQAVRRVLLSAGRATIQGETLVLKTKKKADLVALLRELIAELELKQGDRRQAAPGVGNKPPPPKDSG